MNKTILFLSPIPPPVGGIASWTLNVLNYYSENLSQYNVINQNTAIRFGSLVKRRRIIRLYKGILNTIMIIFDLVKNLNRTKPDLVHLANSGSFSMIKDLLLIKIILIKKIPVVVHFHFGRIPILKKDRNWEWKLFLKLVKCCNGIVVLDDASYNCLLGMGYKNVSNIPNPISLELEKMATKEKEQKTVKNLKRLVFVGHVIPYKGVYELVNSCLNLGGILEELVMIGPYNESIKQELITISRQSNEGKWLNFIGSVPKEKVLEYLSKSTILVLPSYTEGFPNVVLEAMAMGCAVIATEVGAIPEMIDIGSGKSCGVCIKPKDIEELSSELSKALLDPNTTKEMGLNGIDKVINSYGLKKIVEKYEAVWSKYIIE